MNADSRLDKGARMARTSLTVSAVVGVILGVIAVFWPGHTLVAIATLLGIALVVSGAFRIVLTLVVRGDDGGVRTATLVLGIVMVVVGVIALLAPKHTLVFVAILIGIGWLASGIRDLVFAMRGATGQARTLALVAGVVQVVGGVVLFILPGVGLTTFAVVGGLLLIVVSVATLLTFPARRHARATQSRVA